jgi:hypothetical protein
MRLAYVGVLEHGGRSLWLRKGLPGRPKPCGPSGGLQPTASTMPEHRKMKHAHHEVNSPLRRDCFVRARSAGRVWGRN